MLFRSGWRDAAPFDQIFVHLDDGRVLASPRVRRATGHADTPLPAQAVREKFLGCARHAGVSDTISSALHDRLQSLDAVSCVTELDLPALVIGH